jgi:hypothetical protein
MGRRKRRRVDPADDWLQLELLCVWEEQREYERIRPLVLFGGPVPERSAETGVPDLDLPRPRGLFHLRAELARRDYDDQGTPTHDRASTPRDQDAPAFGEQLRELL